MSDEKPSSKWEEKQRAAKAAEKKFEENQRRPRRKAKKGKAKGTGVDAQLDAVGDALGTVTIGERAGVLGWVIAHRKAVTGVAVVLLAGGIIFAVCKFQSYQLRTAPGQPRSELFVGGAEGGTLIVIDHVAIGGSDSKGRPQAVTTEGQRLTALDVDTGKQVAVAVSDYKKCWSGGPRVVCVDTSDRVELLDPRTLEATHKAADLIATAKLAKPTRRFEREGAAVVVVLEDGRGARIDPATLAVTVVESVQSAFAVPESSGCATGSQIKIDATRLILSSAGTRNTLSSDPPPPAESPTPSGPALTFLQGRFLWTTSNLPLVLHSETMDKRDRIVTRVDGISKEKWTAPLGGECRRAWIVGPMLVVATDNPAQRAISLDLASGRVVWTFGR